jgi:hypothetical protein
VNQLNSNYDTPIAQKYKERYNMQTTEIKERLDTFRNTDYQLKVIKKTTKPKIETKDVFLLSPREGVYFYGKVLKTKIKTINNDTFVEGKQVVLIFKCKTKTLTMDSFNPDCNELLIAPSIVDKSYWAKGYFYTIGSVPLSDMELNLDYGFFKSGIPGIRDGWFCTAEGERLKKEPKLMGIYGIATITGIAATVETELIINDSLLKF